MPFGGTVRYSKVMRRVFDVDGVESVSSMIFVVDDEPQPECRDVPIPANALVYTTVLQLNVTPAEELEEVS